MNEINIINNIIAQSILHGSDGYSYDSNEEDLVSAIYDWIKFKGIQADYEICKCAKILLDDTRYLLCPQIRKKE